MLRKFFDVITRASVKARWLTLFLTLAILAAGVYSLTGLNQELLPKVEFPQTIVVVQWPDAESADNFLHEITIPLEETLDDIDGVVNVESTTNQSFAFIVVRNEFGLNQDKIAAEVEAVVNGAGIPAEAESNVLNFSFSDLPVIVTSASSSTLSLAELKEIIETDLQPRIEGVDEISQVTVSGGQELPEEVAEVIVEVEPTPEPTPLPSPTPDPTAIPEAEGSAISLILKTGLAGYGFDIETAQEITVEMAQTLVGFGPISLPAIEQMSPDNLRALDPQVLAYMPTDYIDQLDADLVAELNELSADFGGVGQFSLADSQAAKETGVDILDALAAQPAEPVTVAAVPLPESWIAGASAQGVTIATTDDLTQPLVAGFAAVAAPLLGELTPEMLMAMPLDALQGLPVEFFATLDPDTITALQTRQQEVVADTSNAIDPVALPASWIAGAEQMGLTLATTADLNAQLMQGILAAAPETLTDLTPEVILAMPSDVLAVMPPEFFTTLDADTLAQLQARQAAEVANAPETVAEAEPVDPARLSDFLITGAQQAGLDIEFAQDIPADFARTLSALGEQGLQALGFLTADNLRRLQPEVIALLPLEFLDTLDADLRGELDELASEFGGAGQLAISEAEALAEISANSPDLITPWIEPNPDTGEASQFMTAADILNNPFVPTEPKAANFLNVFPTSAEVDVPSDWIYALTPDVIAYLVENEDGFAAGLDLLILEWMQPDSLTYLLDNQAAAFDSEMFDRLSAIAAGDVEVFIPEASITRTNLNPSVGLNIFKNGDANTVVVAKDLFAVLEEFDDANPEVDITLAFEQATFIEESISGVAKEGALGALFAVIVILVFLSGMVNGKYKLSWRSTIITALSIPASILFAFLLMRILPPTVGNWVQTLSADSDSPILKFIAQLFPSNITINIMTLSGLTVAIGRVVDDSIVVLENIYRFIQNGDDPFEAVVEGTREVATAIFSATVTTMAVFLPLGLVGGIIGQFFMPFGLTVTYALIASYIVSITVVPALAYMLINKDNIPEEKETAMQRAYTPVLEWVLHHRLVTMIVASAIFAGSIFLMGNLPQSFIPALGEPTINVLVSLDDGTPILETNELIQEFENRVFAIDGIEQILSEVGGTGGFEALFGGSGISQNAANLTIAVESQDDIDALTLEVREIARELFSDDNFTASAGTQDGGQSAFALVMTGDSVESLLPIINDAKAAMGALDGDNNGQPDLVNISTNVDEALETGELGSIIRIDGRPAVSFSAGVETADAIGIIQDALNAVNALDLPAGATIAEGFDSQQQTQGFQDMATAILGSIAIVYLIMALSFRSLVHPFTILFSLPFALVGAAIALSITDSVLGISAMIGLLMLVGVVVTNGIVLMEMVQQLKERGHSTYDALVEAGRTRLRPIWMTALTAILALVPTAMSEGGGAIIAAELARTVMGGLLVSTALTLLVIPIVYSAFDGLMDLFRGKKGKSAVSGD